jgi:hypothetical protein
MKALSILTLAFFISSFFYVPENAHAKRVKRTLRKSQKILKDPYKKLSHEEFVEMTQRDYRRFLDYALKTGLIKSEQEVYDMISKANLNKGMTAKEKKALQKRGVATDPSFYIGASRHKLLLSKGFDINTSSGASGKHAAELLRQRGFLKIEDRELISKYKETFDFLLELFIKNADARTTGTTTRSTRGSTSYSTTSSRSNYVVTTAPDYGTTTTSTPRMDDEDLAALEDLIDQEAVADSWTKMKAAETKGAKDLDKQIDQKKKMGTLVKLAGLALMGIGLYKLMDTCHKGTGGSGSDDVSNFCKINDGSIIDLTKIQSTTTKVTENMSCAEAKKAEATLTDSAKVEESNLSGAQACKLMLAAERSACCIKNGCDGACNLYKENDIVGYAMLAAGAALLYYGMTLDGEAARMEDEMAAQDAKNAEIDAARQKLEDKEQQKIDAKKKIIKYRMRTKQIREQEDLQRRQDLQDAANSAR